jgi:hypothetical protein
MLKLNSVLSQRAMLAVVSCFSVSYAGIPLHHTPTEYAFSYENVNLPDDQTNMGLLGVNYLYHLPGNFYTGVGGYAAVKGKRGGFFTLGFDAGMRHHLTQNIVLDAGLYVGGGGAHNSFHDEGEGLMLRSHLGLDWRYHDYLYGVSYARLEYPSGTIRSNDLVFNVNVPSNLAYADFDDMGEQYDSGLDAGYTFPTEQLGLIHQTYFLRTGSGGKTNVQLLGAQGDHFFTPKLYTWVSAAGAYKGQDNGYMEVFGGVGWQSVLLAKTRLVWRNAIAVGAGGGGGAVTGGGLLLKVKSGLQYEMTPNWLLSVDAGYVRGKSDKFKGYVLSAGVNYQLRFAKYGGYAADFSPPYKMHGMRVRGENITYVSPQYAQANKSGNVDLFGVGFDLFLNKNVYLTGEAASAYAGDAASYATGLFGAGYRYQLSSKCYLDGTLQVGAAGGGGIAVDEGALWQPSVGLDYSFMKNMTASFQLGKVKAFKGGLNTTTFTVGVSRDFSLLSAG